MQDGVIGLDSKTQLCGGVNEQMELQSQLKSGRFEDLSLRVQHPSGDAQASGSVDLSNSEVDIAVVANLTDISTWLPEWVALIDGQYTVQGTWQTPTLLEVQGQSTISDVHNADGMGVRKAVVQLKGFGMVSVLNYRM